MHQLCTKTGKCQRKRNAKLFLKNNLAHRVKNQSGEDRTRTTAENAGNATVQAESGAKYGALGAETPEMDTELQAIIDAWPSLSDDVKAGIMAMVRADR